MPFLARRCGAKIAYETKGSGFPVLLIAPGGADAIAFPGVSCNTSRCAAIDDETLEQARAARLALPPRPPPPRPPPPRPPRSPSPRLYDNAQRAPSHGPSRPPRSPAPPRPPASPARVKPACSPPAALLQLGLAEVARAPTPLRLVCV